MNYMFSPMPWLGYREAPSDGSLIKSDGEHGSCGLAVLCLYGSTLTGYDHARQRKPDPKAFAVGILALIEALKDMRQILRRNARAVVLNYNFGIQGVFGCVNFDPAALGGCVPCSSSQYCRWLRRSTRDLPGKLRPHGCATPARAAPWE